MGQSPALRAEIRHWRRAKVIGLRRSGIGWVCAESKVSRREAAPAAPGRVQLRSINAAWAPRFPYAGKQAAVSGAADWEDEMTTFDDREKAFEAKFSHDLEMNFRADARRTKDLAIWAAKQMGLNDKGIVLYAKKVLQVSIEHPGVDGVLAKIKEDLEIAGVTPDRPVEDVARDFLRAARVSVLRDFDRFGE